MLKPYSQAYNEVLSEIQARNKDISVHPNSVVNDIFIVPTSYEIVREVTIADYVTRLQSLDLCLTMLTDTSYLSLVAFAYGTTTDTISAEISSNIDKMAANFKLTRKPNTYATGIVYFYVKTALVPGDSDIVIYRGSKVKSSSNEQYEVQGDVVMYASIGSSYYNVAVDNGSYAVPVTVQAINAGTVGNTPIDTIRTMVTSISGIDGIQNVVEFSNATDAETDAELVDRIKLVYSGNNVGTKDGYKKLILNNSIITDVYVAGSGDGFMIRDSGYGGKIDIYILESHLEQQVDTVAVASQYFTLTKQPADPTSVTISGHGSAVPVIENGYDAAYTGSVLDTVRIRWSDYSVTPPTVPYTVTYTYKNNVETIQNLVDVETNKIVFGTADAVLVKQSIEVPIDISFTISVFSGYSKASVAQDIYNLIIQRVSALKLGASLQQSDVIAWAYEIVGLDQVHIPMSKFNRSALVPTTSVVDTITAEGREYIRISNLSVS